MRKAGIVILMVGLLLTLYAGFSYVTRDRAADWGELVIIKNSRHTMHWHAYVGIGAIVVGGLLVMLAVNRKDEKKVLDT